MQKSVYLGNFVKGLKSGFGKFQTNKYVYIGGWLLDQMHGVGYFEARNGDTYFGYWEMGKRVGFGIERTQNYQYKGEWKNDLPNGLGFHIDKFKNCRPAEFQDGKIVDFVYFGEDASAPTGNTPSGNRKQRNVTFKIVYLEIDLFRDNLISRMKQ